MTDGGDGHFFNGLLVEVRIVERLVVHRVLAEAVELFAAGLERSHNPADRALVDKYLAMLKPVLADTSLGKDVLHQIAQVERMFGHSWLIDHAPFEPAFAKWREFRRNYETRSSFGA